MKFTVLCVVCWAALAWADDLPTFAAWEDAHQFDCNAPYTTSPASQPQVDTYQGFTYTQSGATLKVRRADSKRKGGPVLGLLAGIKDFEPETKANLDRFFQVFEANDVDAVLIGGDSAEEPEVLDKIDAYLADVTKRPVIAVVGNTERAGAHNYAIGKLRKAGKLNLINASLVRRYDGDGFDLVTLGGYFDKRFLHLSGGCLYTPKSIDEVAQAAHDSDDPVIYLGHGPPHQTSKQGIDVATGAGNVGDPALTEMLGKAKIEFGVFGHILEAAGKGTDLKGNVLPAKKLHPQLYLNPGSANPLVWAMNDGSKSYGLAMVLKISGKQASYEVLRAPKPPPSPAE